MKYKYTVICNLSLRIMASLKIEVQAWAFLAESIHRNFQRDSELTNQSSIFVEVTTVLIKQSNYLLFSKSECKKYVICHFIA